MRGNSTVFSKAATAAVLSVTAMAGAPALAQSANTWSLPEPSSAPSAPGAPGPVDGQNPVVRPSPSPNQAAPSPVPTIVPPPPAPVRGTPAPQPQPSAIARPTSVPSAAAARSNAGAAVTHDPAPQTSPVATVADTLPNPSPTVTDEAAPGRATPAGPTEDTAAASSEWPVWWWAAPLAALAGLGAAIALLRRRRAKPEMQEWEEAATIPLPDETLQPVVMPQPAAPEMAAEPSSVSPQPAYTVPETAALVPSRELAFEPVSLRLSLVYATLQYRVTLVAGSDLPADRLLGDMIGAHGSIPPEQQLAPSLDSLTLLKTFPAVAAGESVTLSGEIQLPLGAIRALQQGNASYFVPLVRLCLVAEDGSVLRRVYTVGIEGGGAGLSPLRLDTGPQEHRVLAAREVEVARDYSANPIDLRRAVG